MGYVRYDLHCEALTNLQTILHLVEREARVMTYNDV